MSCVGEPRAGHETVDVDPVLAPATGPATAPSPVLVVGAGPAGLECARVLLRRGREVRVVDRAPMTGGTLRAAAVGPGRERLADLTGWLAAECGRLGVVLETRSRGDRRRPRCARAPTAPRWC